MLNISADMALKLVESHPPLATVEYYGGESLLSAVASKTSAFPSGIKHNFWTRVIYCCEYLRHHKSSRV